MCYIEAVNITQINIRDWKINDLNLNQYDITIIHSSKNCNIKKNLMSWSLIFWLAAWNAENVYKGVTMDCHTLEQVD